MTRRVAHSVPAFPIAVLLLLAAACGGALSGAKHSPGVMEQGSFKPSLTPTANYGPDPALTCPDRGINGLVNEELSTSPAKPEGRLCAVADTLLGWEANATGEIHVPPENVLTVISSDFGLPQTARKVILTNVNTEEKTTLRDSKEGAKENEVATMIAEPIRAFAANAAVPRYGVATTRVKKGVTRVVVVMQDQNLELQPVPRKLNPGQTATLAGSVAGKLTSPKVSYTDAVGKLEKAEAQGGGKAFSTKVACGDRPGRIIVQVTAEQEGADVLLANFPIACGTDLPVAASVQDMGAAQAATTDPATAEKQLAELINKERTTAGVKPVEVDADLSKVARSLSEDRAKGKGTTSDEVQQRLKALDISAPTILVSEAQAFGAEDAWQRFSNSPQDRSNAMNPEMTQVGIGVAPGPKIDNRPMVIVTQLFLKQLPPPNPDEVKTNLYQAIQRKRSDARAGGVTKDPQLEQIAQAYAAEMAKDKGNVPKARVSEIEAPLYKSFSTVNEMGGVKADPMEFAEEPGVVGDAKLVGIGVGVGSSPQFGKNSTYVVILMGKKHAVKGSAPAAKAPPPKKK